MFLTTNINGICSNSKWEELQAVVHTRKVHVAVICETHLNFKVPDNRIALNGYFALRKDRNFSAANKSKGGGIVIYLEKTVPFITPKINVPDELEVLWVVLRPSSPDSIIVAGIYLPPDSAAPTRHLFIKHLVETIDCLRAARPKSKTVLLGDFNAQLKTDELERLLSIQNIVHEPTRGKAILDKIITDIESHIPPLISSELGTADHKTVLWTMLMKQQSVRSVRTFRPLRDSNIRQFGNWICTQNWEEVTDSRDIDIATETLESNLWQAYEKFFPEISYKCRKK